MSARFCADGTARFAAASRSLNDTILTMWPTILRATLRGRPAVLVGTLLFRRSLNGLPCHPVAEPRTLRCAGNRNRRHGCTKEAETQPLAVVSIFAPSFVAIFHNASSKLPP
mmetsp:Transcript_3082/g.10539  ORF Transcript_3082/g.10539 Transcript_3082/m.10539 type:complete len:112 (+) Transcript_3082:1033-1368(+)